MVKNIFSSLSKGFFYTIGRIIAFIFIGLVIGTIITKIDPKILNNLIMQVHAETVNNDLYGTMNFYNQRATIPNRMGTSWNSDISYVGGQYGFPTFTDQIIMPTMNDNGTWVVNKRIAINVGSQTFTANQSYTMYYDFYFNYYDNYLNAMQDVVTSRNIWETSNDTNIYCTSPNGNCSVTYTKTDNYLRLTINFVPYQTQGYATFNVGSLDIPGKMVFGILGTRPVVVNCKTAKISYVNNGTNQDVANSITNNSNNIINNNNNNTNQIINNQNENSDKIVDSFTSEEEPETNDFFDDLPESNYGPVTDLVTMPIRLYQKILYGINDGNCYPYTLGSLYNHTITLPCIDLKARLGEDLYNMIDNCMFLFLFYEICMFLISIYENFTTLHDAFDSLYVPKHAEYKPKHGGGE